MRIIALLFLALMLTASTVIGQVSSDQRLFAFAGQVVYAKTLMGKTKQEYVSAIMPLFSWSNPDALDKEIKHNFGDQIRKEKSQIEVTLGNVYDKKLNSRLEMLLAGLVVDRVGVRGFHFDKVKVESVIKASSAYETEWDQFLQGVASSHNPDEVYLKTQIFNKKCQACYAWYKPENEPRPEYYSTLIGSRAIQIELAMMHLCRAEGWDQESFDRLWCKLGNFAYENSHVVQPEIAPKYIDQYAQQFIAFNVFIARMGTRTNLDKIEGALRKTVTKDGYFAGAALDRLNSSMRELDGSLFVVHQVLNKTEFKSLFGFEMEVNTQGVIADSSAVEGLYPVWKDTSRAPVYHYFVINAIKGSEGYARDPKFASPEHGKFANFIGEKHLSRIVEDFYKKIEFFDKAHPHPSFKSVCLLLQGADIRSLCRGFEGEKLAPID